MVVDERTFEPFDRVGRRGLVSKTLSAISFLSVWVDLVLALELSLVLETRFSGLIETRSSSELRTIGLFCLFDGREAMPFYII